MLAIFTEVTIRRAEAMLTDASSDHERVWYDVESRTCLALSDTRLSWPASAEQCRRLRGGRLAVLDTAEQLSTVGRMTTAADQPAAWIGGRREPTTWTWSDGTVLGN